MDRLFDNILKVQQIEYGIISGDKKIIYIKAGNGGSIYGYENKYLKMAKQINNCSGYNVVVASNPVDIALEDCIDLDMKFLREINKLPATMQNLE